MMLSTVPTSATVGQQPLVSEVVFFIKFLNLQNFPCAGGELPDPGDHLSLALPPPNLPHRYYSFRNTRNKKISLAVLIVMTLIYICHSRSYANLLIR